MKRIFAGPTLYGARLEVETAYTLFPPARQGDIFKAVEEGATVIGLIDGLYEYVPAVWHKEILYGLSKGVLMFGAASMGALRAAECHQFGMIGIGTIYDSYISGARNDDADVAQAHAPAEMGFLPASEPLVNVEATLSKCLNDGLIDTGEHAALLRSARDTFFKNRTYRLVVEKAIQDPRRAGVVLAEMRANSVNLKLSDALLLIDAVKSAPDERITSSSEWIFQATHFWDSYFSRA